MRFSARKQASCLLAGPATIHADRFAGDEIGLHWEELGAVRWTVIEGLADYHTEVEGALPSGRYLTGEPIDGSALGPWRDRLRISPYFRTGTTYSDMFTEGRRKTRSRRDEASGDPG